MQLKGKVAIVTGAGQGVGQGIALALADQGAQLALLGRTMEKLKHTAALIEGRGSQALAIACNVKQPADLEKAVQQVIAAYDGVDILVNNAQEVPLGDLLSVSDDAINAGWESGPMATLRLMKLCYPYLKNGGGNIVNLGSAAAKRWDAANYGAYAAVKEAIRALSRAAACEWATDGIRTNVILPHATSPGLKWWIENNPKESQEFIASIPMQRVGECEDDIGKFVAMLCSDSCSYVNGQSIALDGGQAHMG